VTTQTQEASASTADRRRSARQERVVPAWLSERAGGAGKSGQQQVTVTNLSLHGVGFRSEKKIELGGAHWIVIATDTLHLSTRLRVVSCRERENNVFDIGGEFF
jgi:ribosomal protein L3